MDTGFKGSARRPLSVDNSVTGPDPATPLRAVTGFETLRAAQLMTGEGWVVRRDRNVGGAE